MRWGLGQRPYGARQRRDSSPTLANKIASGRACKFDCVGRLDVQRDDPLKRVFILRTGRKIVNGAKRSHARDTVHRAMMDLDVDGESTSLEPLDERVLPQRARPVERDCMQLSDQGSKLLH